jgi:low temperature requirement protein LtrA
VVVSFPMVFFAIWFAWMNFSWFASAYDTDDALYRVMVLVQMTGVLVLAAGVPRAMDHGNFAVVTVGYVIMRLGLVFQWLRAAWSDPPRRVSDLRYALGVTVVQAGWVVRLSLPSRAGAVGFGLLVILELVVPVWAESPARTTWHPGHMAERYGLFTIIVLGESVLAATVGTQRALDAHTPVHDLATTVVGGLLIVFSLFWIYFDAPVEEITAGIRDAFSEQISGAFRWGYGHYFIFASAAATGAGLAVDVDRAAHESHVSQLSAGLAITVPVAVFLMSSWVVHRPGPSARALVRFGPPSVAAGVLVVSFVPEPVLLTGLLVAGLVAGSITIRRPVEVVELPEQLAQGDDAVADAESGRDDHQ